MTDYEKLSDRELDQRIALKIMGFKVVYHGGGSALIPPWLPPEANINVPSFHYIPNYSTNIAAAWELVEKYSTWPWCFTRSGETFKFDLGYEGRRYSAIADTAPRAICLAALRAVDNG